MNGNGREDSLTDGRGSRSLVGGLAWKAYSRYSDSGLPIGRARSLRARGGASGSGWNVAPPPKGAGFLIVLAMIDAAKADGHIDAREQQRIFKRIDELGLSADEKVMLLEALRRPADMESIVDQVHRPEDAAEVYMAALLAIDRSAPGSPRYLKRLAQKLALPEPLVVELTLAADEVDTAPPAAAESQHAFVGTAVHGSLR